MHVRRAREPERSVTSHGTGCLPCLQSPESALGQARHCCREEEQLAPLRWRHLSDQLPEPLDLQARRQLAISNQHCVIIQQDKATLSLLGCNLPGRDSRVSLYLTSLSPSL